MARRRTPPERPEPSKLCKSHAEAAAIVDRQITEGDCIAASLQPGPLPPEAPLWHDRNLTILERLFTERAEAERYRTCALYGSRIAFRNTPRGEDDTSLHTKRLEWLRSLRGRLDVYDSVVAPAPSQAVPAAHQQHAGEAYDVAQFCLNGHLINDSARSTPAYSRAYCAACGARTVTACVECEHAIPGAERLPPEFATEGCARPAFCSFCGKPYPARSLEAARELAAELEGLTDEDRTALAGTLDDLLAETPRTQVAATRFKRLLSKAGKGAAESLRSIMVDVMSEAAKKTIFGGP